MRREKDAEVSEIEKVPDEQGKKWIILSKHLNNVEKKTTT